MARKHNTIPAEAPPQITTRNKQPMVLTDEGKVLRYKHITVDARIWNKARKLCEGDFNRIEVRSDTEIVVHNNLDWRHK